MYGMGVVAELARIQPSAAWPHSGEFGDVVPGLGPGFLLVRPRPPGKLGIRRRPAGGRPGHVD